MAWRRGSINRASIRSTRSRRAAARGSARASRPVLVGGVDLEMTQPRLNEAVLRRLAAESSGRYVRADQAGSCRRCCASRAPKPARRRCATSGTMGGVCWRSSDCWPRNGLLDDGWDLRDAMITRSTQDHRRHEASIRFFVFFVLAVRVRVATLRRESLGRDHFRRVGRREVRRADDDVAQRPARGAGRSLPVQARVREDVRRRNGDVRRQGLGRERPQVLRRDQEDRRPRTTSCSSSCSATAPTTATSRSSTSSGPT